MLFLEAAEHGHAASQYQCGSEFSSRYPGEQGLKQAFFWYGKAAGQGHREAQYHCGICCQEGRGTEQDYSKALYWYEKAAEQGSAAAQLNCGLLLAEGKGAPMDKDRALRLVEQSAKQGYGVAQKILPKLRGEILGEGEEPRTPKEASESAAPGSSGTDTPELWYQNGMAALEDMDYPSAFSLFEKAALKGHREAQYQCGKLCDAGKGTKLNAARAYYWYEKAAGQGHEAAQCLCGVMREGGLGVARDADKARQWYCTAAAQGSVEALNCLAWMNESEGNRSGALSIFEEAARAGDLYAAEKCGEMYYEGIGTRVNKAAALRWYQQAAEGGSSSAQFQCGEMYRKGEGTAADSAKALAWYERAAAQGHLTAQYQCGLMYRDGAGTAADQAIACLWFERAAEEEHEKAQQLFDKLFVDISCRDTPYVENAVLSGGALPDDTDEGYAEALPRFAIYALQEENAEAALCCAGICAKIRRSPTDKIHAFLWTAKAAEWGSPDGQYRCGEIYAKGEGVPVDKAKALHWYEEAAEQGHARAQAACGAMYAKGDGVEKDLAKAAQWLQKAAGQGEPEAVQLLPGVKEALQEQENTELTYKKAFLLGQLSYMNGDYQEALERFTEAAELGYAKAQSACGSMYDNGEGTQADPEKALVWYERAAAQGDAAAQFNCGVMYTKSQNFAEAVKWFEKAARQGDGEAQYNCGYLYFTAIHNLEKARHWLTKASEQTKDKALQEKALKTLKRVEEIFS